MLDVFEKLFVLFWFVFVCFFLHFFFFFIISYVALNPEKQRKYLNGQIACSNIALCATRPLFVCIIVRQLEFANMSKRKTTGEILFTDTFKHSGYPIKIILINETRILLNTTLSGRNRMYGIRNRMWKFLNCV